jgi:hypothetical protein
MTCIKTGGVDLIVQKCVEGKKEIDWNRNMTFLTFGMCYQGAWQYYLFNRVMPRIAPGAFKFAAKSLREKARDVKGMKNVLVQNFVENGINNPLLFFPTFYTLKELISAGKWTFHAVCASARNGVGLYRKNFWSDITACWSLWIPAQTLNFAFSPAWFRVPFVAIVSAGWTAYVSITRGNASSCDVNESEKESDATANGDSAALVKMETTDEVSAVESATMALTPAQLSGKSTVTGAVR